MRWPLVRVGLLSLISTLIALGASLVLLKLYDRMLPAPDAGTLIRLVSVAAAAIVAMAALDVLRARTLLRLATRFDAELAPSAFAAVLSDAAPGRPLRDVHAVRAFLAGPTMPLLMDVPWSPLLLAAVFFLHPYLGALALMGAAMLCGLALLNERMTRDAVIGADGSAYDAVHLAENHARSADVVRAMGMLPALRVNWDPRHGEDVRQHGIAHRSGAWIAACAKLLRFALQMTMLGLGAYLVFEQRCTAGAMIAAAILAGRALAPIEGAIANWRAVVQARNAYARLSGILAAQSHRGTAVEGRVPSGALHVENVVAGVPGVARAVIRDVTFTLTPGECLAIVGPSGAGKSSLARVLVGAWPVKRGRVRLDAADLSDWPRHVLGPHIGYLPQDVDLLHGTVAQNIARFGEIAPAAVVDAAELAGANAMILQLPKGYDTIVGPNGHVLSGGQRQRIGLARAFYRAPTLIVLDEPTSSLDADGAMRVGAAVAALKSGGRTIVLINPDPALLSLADTVLRLEHGRVTHLGPAGEVLAQIAGEPASGANALLEVATAETA